MDRRDMPKLSKADEENKNWLSLFPKPIKDQKLTFRKTMIVATNSVEIDPESIKWHQYEYQVTRELSDKTTEIVTDPIVKKRVFNKLSIKPTTNILFCTCVQFVFSLKYSEPNGI